jgi:hypothetical protein
LENKQLDMLKTLSIIFFAVIGACQEKVQDDYIRIDHIGINSGDHTQIVDLIISVNQKKVRRSFEKNIIVSEKLFDEIKSYVTKQNNHITKMAVQEFSAFNISIFSDGKVLNYAVSSKSKSTQYFTDLRKIVPESPSLTDELDKLLTLINQ